MKKEQKKNSFYSPRFFRSNVLSFSVNSRNYLITIIRKMFEKAIYFSVLPQRTPIDYILFFSFLSFFFFLFVCLMCISFSFSCLPLSAFRHFRAIIERHQSARLVAALNICPLNTPTCTIAIFDFARTIINFH